jgi:hemoglobin/transferrin/lactoferrin receptor protein
MQTRPILLTICGAMAAPAALAQEGEPITLDPIVVSTGLSVVASQTPQAVSVVDERQLAIAQPTTIADAMRTLPGVAQTGSNRVLGEGFNIRGFGSDVAGGENRLIIQIDGTTKYFQQYRLGSVFTDPELYKQIEVLRGPASSTLYGSGAIAGVISLETRDASDFLAEGDTFAIRPKFQPTSNGEGYMASLFVAARPVEELELLGAFIYRDNDDYQDGNGDTVPGSAFSAPSGLLKARYHFGDELQHNVWASYQQWETSEDDSEYDQTGGTGGAFGTVDRDVMDRTSTFGYEYAPPDNPLIDFELVGGYSYTRVRQSDSNSFIPSPLFADSEYSYETWQVRAQNTSVFGGEGTTLPQTFLTYGVQYSDQKRVGEAASGFIDFHPGGTDEKLAAYAQAEIYAGRWTVIPGLRYERSELDPDGLNPAYSEGTTNDAFSPKLALLYQLTDSWNVFGSIARTERLPTLDEVYDGLSGNLNLDPEKAITYEAGISYAANDVFRSGDAMVGKLTLFQNDVENLIERISTTDTFRNVGEARIRGIEFEGAYETERMFGRATYSLIRGDNLVTDEPLSSIPADEVTLTLGTRLPAQNLELGWTGIFARAQDRVPLAVEESPGYGVSNVYASWTPQTGALAGGELIFGVENIFDKFYQPHLQSDPARGRTFTLTLAAVF